MLIDPIKADTIPFKLQQFRNQFAAKKRAEEEERRRREAERQQAEQARAKMKQDIEDDFKAQFYARLNQANNGLTAIDNSVTLENYDVSVKAIRDVQTTLPVDFIENLHTTMRIPVGVTIEEIQNAEKETKERLMEFFTGTYEYQIQVARDYILDRLPSKKANLERIAQASAEDAARIKAEMEARQRREAELQETERRRKEEEERQKAELARQQSEIGSLFSAVAVQQEYQPKTKVSKKIEILNPEGIMPILIMWWNKEGSKMSVEELTKIFKKQITYCEKLAKEGTLIQDESVCYVDDVKAK